LQAKSDRLVQQASAQQAEVFAEVWLPAVARQAGVKSRPLAGALQAWSWQARSQADWDQR
jgi:hypothetical protein